MKKWIWVVCVVTAIVVLAIASTVGLILGRKRMSKSAIRRIAIVGAGAGGSSAAFFLDRQLRCLNLRDDVEITVYEKELRVGGRTAVVHPYNDPQYDPVEIGASIYVQANLHLVNAIKQFNLQEKSPHNDDDHVIYLYNGKTRLVDMDKLTTRYNPFSLMKMQMLTQSTVQRFLRLYQRHFQLSKGPFRTVEDYIQAIDLKATVNESGSTFLLRNGLDQMTVNELVDSITLGTYGQQVTKLHAVMTLIALAGRGSSVRGGNYQIFENMLKASAAKLKTNQTVTQITKDKRNEKWIVTTTDSSNRYDIVILATPPHQSNIALTNLRDEIGKVDYVQQHVTLFASNATHLSSTYQNISLPVSLLVTRYLERQNQTADLNLDVEAIHSSPFLSPRKDRLFKLVSPMHLDDSKLATIVDGRSNIAWVYRRMWFAYPRAPPTNNFIFPSINPDRGLYYVNAFETFISTMETQCLAAHNIVRLLLKDYGYDHKTATTNDDYWIDPTN